MRRHRAQLALAATLLTLSLSLLQAQTSRGTVSGLITEPPPPSLRATVDLRHTQTGVTRQTASNQAAPYRFDAVDVGPSRGHRPRLRLRTAPHARS